mmetsp:Transcript_34384/g.42084  ORF Transcript_34384/g.42084 Transcript_34384/m.42084 type:complete len:533 (-) Transcript_34384:127-1725(-)
MRQIHANYNGGNRNNIDEAEVNDESTSTTKCHKKNHLIKTRLLELIQGVSLYLLCISIPALLGMTVQFYENQIAHHRHHHHRGVHNEKIASAVVPKYVCEMTGWWCNNVWDETVVPLTPKKRRNIVIKSIVFLSVTLLSVRMALIYALLRKNGEKGNNNGATGSGAFSSSSSGAPKQSGANFLLRCKSVHLLSDLDKTDDGRDGKKMSASLTVGKMGSDESSGGDRTTASGSNTASPNTISGKNSTPPTAPRYATALFRLIYTFFSSTLALYLFRHASFWPRHLFGTHPHSSTKNCWDLSGSIFGQFDSDFDHYNSALQSYFVVSMSYHLQSLLFHCASVLVMFFSFGLVQRRKLTSVVAICVRSYFRPLAEHLAVMVLIAVCFVFSSLRRLGAVGIFTLDFSSFFLHLLVIGVSWCGEDGDGEVLDAGNGKYWRRQVVVFIHRFLVIPTFLYCRFFVFPFVIFYSLVYESRTWLTQMEHAFTPGWANTFVMLFNGLSFVLLVLNLALFQKLLYYPPLRQILKKRRKDNVTT